MLVSELKVRALASTRDGSLRHAANYLMQRCVSLALWRIAGRGVKKKSGERQNETHASSFTLLSPSVSSLGDIRRSPESQMYILGGFLIHLRSPCLRGHFVSTSTGRDG